jgi:1-deoxyxylulose-5-phosphate synthase
MAPLDRRTFLGATAGVAAATQFVNSATADSPPPVDSETSAAALAVPPPPLIKLGSTGITTTRLAQGTGVFGGARQSNQTRLGFAKLVALFRHAYERGLRFFDLADLYGTHIYFREALRTFPREKVTILTKMWWRYDGPEAGASDAFRAQMARTTLERFRHELATDYLDIVLLHCLTDASWNKHMTPYLETLTSEKDEGRIKALGVSCHDIGALRTAAETPWVDVILARINPRGVKMDGSPDEVSAVLRSAKAAGKAIIGMKIFGEGQLVGEREQCMEFAQSQEYLDALTIGFEQPQQIDDVLQLMARYPAKTA